LRFKRQNGAPIVQAKLSLRLENDLPIGILAFFLVRHLVQDPPWIKDQSRPRQSQEARLHRDIRDNFAKQVTQLLLRHNPIGHVQKQSQSGLRMGVGHCDGDLIRIYG
jgi:hypothetical protein